MEYFKVSNEYLTIKKAFGNYGKAQQYIINNVNEIEQFTSKQNSFANVMAGSFWDMGNETLSFNYQGKLVVFGKQLDESEAKAFKTFMESEIKKRVKKLAD